MRHKAVTVINAHPSVKFALDFAMSLISDKIKKRIKIYTSLDDALKNGMDTSVLPKEYGGVIPMEEMISKFALSNFNNNNKGCKPESPLYANWKRGKEF